MIPPPEVTGNGELRRDQLLHPSVQLLRPLLLLLLEREGEEEAEEDSSWKGWRRLCWVVIGVAEEKEERRKGKEKKGKKNGRDQVLEKNRFSINFFFYI